MNGQLYMSVIHKNNTTLTHFVLQNATEYVLNTLKLFLVLKMTAKIYNKKTKKSRMLNLKNYRVLILEFGRFLQNYKRNK